MTKMTVTTAGTVGKHPLYIIENQFGKFFIDELNGRFIVSGSIAAARYEFRQIHRQPPNEYGNFYKREKAGFEACREIIAKYSEKED